jgi:hypothetical protein
MNSINSTTKRAPTGKRRTRQVTSAQLGRRIDALVIAHQLHRVTLTRYGSGETHVHAYPLPSGKLVRERTRDALTERPGATAIERDLIAERAMDRPQAYGRGQTIEEALDDLERRLQR